MHHASRESKIRYLGYLSANTIDPEQAPGLTQNLEDTPSITRTLLALSRLTNAIYKRNKLRILQYVINSLIY